jgi:hypothetical protein
MIALLIDGQFVIILDGFIYSFGCVLISVVVVKTFTNNFYYFEHSGTRVIFFSSI